MNNDKAVFNTIMEALDIELQQQDIKASSTSELYLPWLSSFCFLVDLHYDYIHGDYLFESDFIMNDQSGSILHKQIAEDFLTKQYTRTGKNGCILLYDRIKSNGNAAVSTVANEKMRKSIQEIVHGLVKTLSEQENSIDLSSLISRHGDFYGTITREPNTTICIRSHQFEKNVKSFYNDKRKKPNLSLVKYTDNVYEFKHE